MEMEKRLKVLMLLFTMAWAVLCVRLFYIQIYKGSEFFELSQNQHLRDAKIESRRGDIFDRNGNVIATDLASYSFAVNPRRVKDKWKFATILSREFDHSREYYLKKLKQKRSFTYLERNINAQLMDNVLNTDLKGIQKLTKYNRFYPYGNSLGQITGFTDIDNKGIEGLEYKYNKYLAGVSGKMKTTSDARGEKRPDFNFPITQPIGGNQLVTTIDAELQEIALEELAKGVKEFNAISGTVIMMDPNTGEILALGSVPTFDSNKYGKSSPESRRNRAITDSFEPGSIFKLIPFTAAFELGLVKPEDIIFCENGHVMIGRHRFRDTKPHGNLTVREIMEKSSNIGTYKIAQMVGPDRYYEFIKKFGFAQKTGIEIGGEAPGLVYSPKNWSSLSLSALSIGQEISVNAMQIAAAYSAVANGGNLMKPFLVKSINDIDGNIIKEFKPVIVRRVMSKETAKTLTEFLKGVVERGTAPKAQMESNSVAGKTGTAQKYNKETKRLSQTEYVSSFVGFYPADNPKIVGLVVLDTPKPKYYGGTVAAPILKNILTRLSHLPGNNLLSQKVNLVSDEKESNGFLDKVMSFWTTDDLNSDKNSRKKNLFTAQKDEETHLIDVNKDTKSSNNNANINIVTVPNLKGKTIRDAINILVSNGIDFEIKGAGIVTKQSPKAGTKVKKGSVTIVYGKSTEKFEQNR